VATTSPQRAWRAACPNCGAPVEFRSAAAPFAVCSYCQSTLLREGEALRRIGKSADLFEDHSPLQLQARGRYAGADFTLVGRLQVRYEEGSWNEWHAVFDNGRSGWLSEDNAGYAFSFEVPTPGPLPAFESLRAGAQELIGGVAWRVASTTSATLHAAQGELPFVPHLGETYAVADLRNAQGEVGTIDYSDAAAGKPPRWYVGRGLDLASLALTGLREDSVRELAGRSLQCPNCGAALEVRLDSTRSIVCHQCKAVVDVSQGVGAELAHFTQDDGAGIAHETLIPLGSSGRLALGTPAPQDWQVVGYMERCDVPVPGDDEETSFWREYLLYRREAGFAFLVDAQDGWSWVRPITGVPRVLSPREVSLDGASYRERYTYDAKTTFVLGEFYWRVTRDQRSRNTDYEGTGRDSAKRLNREQTGQEVVWSQGEALEAEAVRRAFALPEARAAAMARDVRPVSGGSSRLLVWFVMLLMVMALLFTLSRCGRDDCEDLRATFGASSQEYAQCVRSGGGGGFFGRTGGGSFGGFSTGGGGHK